MSEEFHRHQTSVESNFKTKRANSFHDEQIQGNGRARAWQRPEQSFQSTLTTQLREHSSKNSPPLGFAPISRSSNMTCPACAMASVTSMAVCSQVSVCLEFSNLRNSSFQRVAHTMWRLNLGHILPFVSNRFVQGSEIGKNTHTG